MAQHTELFLRLTTTYPRLGHSSKIASFGGLSVLVYVTEVFTGTLGIPQATKSIDRNHNDVSLGAARREVICRDFNFP